MRKITDNHACLRNRIVQKLLAAIPPKLPKLGKAAYENWVEIFEIKDACVWRKLDRRRKENWEILARAVLINYLWLKEEIQK